VITRDPNRPPKGRYRRLMTTHFDQETYNARSQVETTNSMVKRNFNSFTRGHSWHARYRELRLKAITHNIAIE